jgi:hypothetical protein
MNFNVIYERVLMRLKEQNDISEEENRDECSEEEIEEASVSGGGAGGGNIEGYVLKLGDSNSKKKKVYGWK